MRRLTDRTTVRVLAMMIAVLGLAMAAMAQIPPKTASGKEVLASASMADPKADAPRVETLTELEQAQATIHELNKQLTQLFDQLNVCRAQLAPQQSKQNNEAVEKAEAELKAKFEAAHPGYEYNPATGKLTPKKK